MRVCSFGVSDAVKCETGRVRQISALGKNLAARTMVLGTYPLGLLLGLIPCGSALQWKPMLPEHVALARGC